MNTDIDEQVVEFLYNQKKHFSKTFFSTREIADWICPYISRHLLSLNPLQARCRRYSRGER